MDFYLAKAAAIRAFEAVEPRSFLAPKNRLPPVNVGMNMGHCISAFQRGASGFQFNGGGFLVGGYV
jgi:hypothetical protein